MKRKMGLEMDGRLQTSEEVFDSASTVAAVVPIFVHVSDRHVLKYSQLIEEGSRGL